MLRTLSLFALLATQVAGQQTWIVDARNRPGTNFTDLPPAVAAADDGDKLIIRSGNYSAFSTGKGLTLLGEGSVRVGDPLLGGTAIEVSGLARGKTFTMARLTAWTSPWSPNVIKLSGNSGQLHLQDVDIVHLGFVDTLGCLVRQCDSVTITGGRFTGRPAIFAVDSALSVVGASLSGGGVCFSPPSCFKLASPGFEAWRCSSHLAHTSVQGGGSSTPMFEPGPALELKDGTAILTGDAATRILGGISTFGVPSNAIVTSGGTLVADTGITILGENGGVPIIGTGTVVRRRVVSLSGGGAPPGGAITAELVSPAGDLFWLIAGFPMAPMPTPFGELSINPLLVVLLATGAQGPRELFQWNALVPEIPALRGAVLGLQVANLYHASQTVEYSNLLVVVIE